MKIYFACSITGGRQDVSAYQRIVQHLKDEGHEVPTEILADPGVLSLEIVVDPVEVYERDTAWIRESDFLIAEVSTPSHGVGYEIAYALGLGKTVMCVHKKEKPVSKMITGNRSSQLIVRSYRSETELTGLLDDFISQQIA